MDKEIIKEFFRFDWRKIQVFLIFIILSILLLYILFKINGYYLMCDPLPCSDLTIFTHWLTYEIGLNIFIILLFINYIFASLTTSYFNKLKK